jgi:hypothetical protein
MAYTINHYNNSLITTVADGTVDATLDIKLIGKNYAGYGLIQNENFVYLLENFASSTGPAHPVAGQVWFDSGNRKLKFWDGSRYRSTGGAEIAPTNSAPSGLTQGDLWFNPDTNQISVWNGTSYTLVGPQAVKGSGLTEMLSTSVLDTQSQPHTIIEAVDNGQVVFIVSPDSEFTLDSTSNASLVSSGFNKIHQGVTLAYTNNSAQPGQTQNGFRFWGTASNSDRLGGFNADQFVKVGNASFSTAVNFADVGYTVGNPTAKLAVYNDFNTTPTIENIYNNTIVFKTTVGGVTVTPMKIVGQDVLPGVTTASNLGNSSYQWANVWATTFNGTATSASTLIYNNSSVSPTISATANTVAIRDTSGNLNAVTFNGASTSSYYADLAEKYLADKEYPVGTVVSVGGEKEITASTKGDKAIGVISENPAYMMNSELAGGIYVALKGRVPVFIDGTVVKGDKIIPESNGVGMVLNPLTDDVAFVFAIALESNNQPGVKLVECVVL